MKELNRENFNFPVRPNKVLQFGEGNFLRCFIDWQIDILNEKCGLNAGVIVVRPIDTDFPPSLNTQDGLYTTVIRGFDDEGNFQDQRRIISSVNKEISVYREYELFLEQAHNPDLRFIVSNTTEAGIAFDEKDEFEQRPPGTYPAKLTRFMFERFSVFSGAADKGFILLPCELIDYNGEKLKEIVLDYCKLWKLDDDFVKWVNESNIFCSTLVDRIVTGHPRDEKERLLEELGYNDEFIVTGEYFHLFVIQAPVIVADELGIANSGLNIKIVDDLKPFKVRKVGILNGCHTAMVPVAFLCGLDYVKESVEDAEIESFIGKLIDEEIIPYLGLPVDYVKEFADSVLGRFKNPYVKHQLISISLNSMTKFKTRLLPQFLNYAEQNQSVPPAMALALAALICFYKGERQKDGSPEKYGLKDDAEFLEIFSRLWAKPLEDLQGAESLVREVLSLEDHWGVNFSGIEGIVEAVAENVLTINTDGMRKALKRVLA